MLLFKAPQLTVLVQCFDASGVMRFPSDPNGYFGFTIPIEQTMAVSKQAAQYAAAKLGRPDLAPKMEALTAIEPILKMPERDPSLLYLMRLGPTIYTADSSWLKLVDYLRFMPQGRMRVAYNKAMQYFAGASHDNVDILELDEEVRNRVKQLMAQDDSSLLE